MLKSLSDVFNQKQMQALRVKMWWVADRQKPFLIKFSLHQDFVLIQLTDLYFLWANKFHIKTLLQQKNQYARSLQIKQDRDLLILFQSLLSYSDAQALYTFTQPKGTQIHFTFNKRLNIFDFKWTLKLTKIDCKPVELICREILNPMSATLQAQTKRIEMLRKKFELIEKDYMRKMSEKQKALYKPARLETTGKAGKLQSTDSQYQGKTVREVNEHKQSHLQDSQERQEFDLKALKQSLKIPIPKIARRLRDRNVVNTERNSYEPQPEIKKANPLFFTRRQLDQYINNLEELEAQQTERSNRRQSRAEFEASKEYEHEEGTQSYRRKEE